ncbi:hypothetical protein, partial [Bifidobacterium breve]|uniref:hypothetical protein n=1 Tax=Bifidobacterium breve TaxID=1685 RepID=UPI0032DF08E5
CVPICRRRRWLCENRQEKRAEMRAKSVATAGHPEAPVDIFDFSESLKNGRFVEIPIYKPIMYVMSV